MKYEIRASHILVNVSADASPADTLKAYNRALTLMNRIKEGEDFGTVASGPRGSDDPSAKENKGDLGYFTAFQMVYPFETAAYNTPIGEVSMPIRTNFGYHVISVLHKSDARRTVTTVHIMVLFNKNASRSEKENAEKKTEEVHQKLQSRESFEQLARLYTHDQGSEA